MKQQTAALLATQMDEAWHSLNRWLKDLTDEEFFWEPVPGCWTVHPAADGRWIIDYADPPPDPLPFTTIAWRVVHIAACKIMYHEYAFGAGRLTWDELEIPHSAASAVARLEKGHPTNWGELWPSWRIFWTMVAHDLQHGAEIGCLRDLYRVKNHSGGK